MASQRGHVGPAGGRHDDRVDPPTPSRRHHLLQNARRRAVIRYYADGEGPTDLGDLAEWVAGSETDGPPTSTDRHRAYVALYQTHLPKLDQADVVEYNRERGVVRAGPLLETFAAAVTADRDGSALADPTERTDRRRWTGGLAAGAGVVVALGLLAVVGAVDATSPTVWIVGGVGVAASVVCHELLPAGEGRTSLVTDRSGRED